MAHVYKMSNNSQIYGLMIIHNDRSKEDPDHARTRENGNIDPNRTQYNYSLVEREDPWQYYKDRQEELEKDRVQQTGQHLRKDAVRCVSVVVYLPEEKERQGEDYERQFFSGCVDYVKNQFGEKNVISAIVHKDENRPHVHILAIPCTKEPDRQGRSYERISFKDSFTREDYRNMHPLLQEHCRQRTQDRSLKIYDEENAKRRTVSKEEYIRQKEEEREKKQHEQDRKQLEKAVKDTPEIKKNVFGKITKEEEDRIRTEQAKTAEAARREIDRARTAEQRAKDEKDRVHSYREIELKGRLEKTETRNIELEKENRRLQKENEKLRQNQRFLDHLRQNPKNRELERQWHEQQRQKDRDHDRNR